MTATDVRLVSGDLEIIGRVMPASNATFLARVDERQVVYKPVAGERPLWDFPDGTLADREVAAYCVSEALGWSVVPTTVLRDGPHGLGMVQVWEEPAEGAAPVDVVPEGSTPPGYRHVLDALGPDDEPVSLVHEDSVPLRRMAVFDLVVNNADRKGGHVLPKADGHRYGVDHGVSFHVEHKLRTVLWGWTGEEVPGEDVRAVAGLLADEALDRRLRDLLSEPEVAAFRRRCQRLVAEPLFPLPSTDWPAVPWPAF